MSSEARIFLIGMGTTTQTAMEALDERFDLCGLVRPGADSVTQDAHRRGIPVHADASMSAVSEVIGSVRPDAVVVSSYDRILPPDLVGRYPFVNVHYAPLPRYRGRATVNWAIINDEPETAISIHCLEPELDAGGILAQQFVKLDPRATARTLYEELNDLQRLLLADAVERRLGGDRGRQQDESLATYCCTRVPEDGEIVWSDSTASIDRLVRALDDPFPSAYTHLGPTRLRVHEAHPVSDAPRFEGRVPGRVSRVHRDDGAVDVLTGDGVLRLTSVSGPDGARVAPARLIRSVKLTLLSGPEARLQQLEAEVAAAATDPVNHLGRERHVS